MDEFNQRFNQELQLMVGELTMNNLGQKLRIEVLAEQLAAAQQEITRLQPKPVEQEQQLPLEQVQ